MLDNLSLEDKSYIIGLFAGDSSLYKQSRNRGKFIYEISIKDKDIIYKLYQLLSKHTNVYISERVRHTNYKKNYKSISLRIHDINFRDDISKYIPYGKKSNIIKYHEDLDAIAFIRGLTDADGSMGLAYNNTQCFWSLCTASESIKNFIVKDIKKRLGVDKRLNRNARDNIYNIVLLNELAQDYTNILYSNASIYLDRKYQSYLDVQN